MGVDTLERYSSYPCVFNTLAITDAIDTDLQFGTNVIDEIAGGSLDVLKSAVANAEPSVSINCLNLAHLATISPTLGLHISAAACYIQYQRRTNGGAFAGTGDLLLKSMQGFLNPISIQASQDSNQAARLALQFIPEYDGTNPTIDIVSDTLESAPAIGAMFRLAKVVVAGTTVRGNQSTRVDFGIDYRVTRADGDIFARVGGIYGRRPRITIESKNLQGFLALTGTTRTQLGGNVVAYFKKEGVANGTGEHVSVTLTTPNAMLTNIAASPSDDPRPAVMFTPTAGSTIAVATNATIS